MEIVVFEKNSNASHSIIFKGGIFRYEGKIALDTVCRNMARFVKLNVNDEILRWMVEEEGYVEIKPYCGDRRTFTLTPDVFECWNT